VKKHTSPDPPFRPSFTAAFTMYSLCTSLYLSSISREAVSEQIQLIWQYLLRAIFS